MGYLTGKIDVQTKLDPKTDLRSGFSDSRKPPVAVVTSLRETAVFARR